MGTYKAKIRIDGIGTAINVSTEAGNPSEAKRIISNKYTVKHWVRQPTRSI